MQIEVITESRNGDASDYVPFLIACLKETDDGMPIVHADAYAVDGLLRILDVRATRGEREILVLNCSRAHVQAVLEWNGMEWNANDDDGAFEDLVLHLVREQAHAQEAADAHEA